MIRCATSGTPTCVTSFSIHPPEIPRPRSPSHRSTTARTLPHSELELAHTMNSSKTSWVPMEYHVSPHHRSSGIDDVQVVFLLFNGYGWISILPVQCTLLLGYPTLGAGTLRITAVGMPLQPDKVRVYSPPTLLLSML